MGAGMDNRQQGYRELTPEAPETGSLGTFNLVMRTDLTLPEDVEGVRRGEASESMGRDAYIIAVKREHRGSEPADWKEQLSDTSGIEVLSTDSSRLYVRASDETINRISSHWGHLCHIEKQIEHAKR